MFFTQVKTLKERIEEEKGKDNFPVSGLKLIYAGMLCYIYVCVVPCFWLLNMRLNNTHLKFHLNGSVVQPYDVIMVLASSSIGCVAFSSRKNPQR